MLVLCQSLLYSKVTQLYAYICFLKFFSIMVYHRSLNIVPCLCYIVGPCLSILNIIVCIYQPQTPSASLSLLPSTLATTSLISMSVSLFLFHRLVHLCHILDSIYKWYHRVFVFLFLTSLSMIISSCIRVVANGIIFFFSFFSWPCLAACWILVPWPGIKPAPPAVKAWSLNHWTTRELPLFTFIYGVSAIQETDSASCLTYKPHHKCLIFHICLLVGPPQN